MSTLLCPSMMCADFACLADEVRGLEAAGADIFHIDIMDGGFVPNFGMGLQDAKLITGLSSKPADVHLMIREPSRYVRLFAEMGAAIMYIHPESEPQGARTLQAIADEGVSPGIAINPGTSAESVRPLLSLAEYVLVMTVNPGFAGQTYLSFVDEKIDELLTLKRRYGYKLLIDGACSPEVIKRLGAKGADGFVLGTSALFGKNRPYNEIMLELRELTA